jgi:hypothetical protein
MIFFFTLWLLLQILCLISGIKSTKHVNVGCFVDAYIPGMYKMPHTL